jgi:hypothetical protein
VGSGYLGRPGLTAEKFVPDPFADAPGARLYLTGDLARTLPDGMLDFLGRVDDQVKIRGFRIELGEIEAALAACPGVDAAAVLARSSDDRPGERRLVAYVAFREAGAESADLRAFLAARLPDYLVPAIFVILKALPRTPNGKIDRKALPAPEAGAAQGGERGGRGEPILPRTAPERFLAGLFRQALGIAEVGVTESFFDLGGDSISGAILINRLQEALGTIVHVVAIFDHETVARLAAFLEREEPAAVARVWGGKIAALEAVAAPAVRVDAAAKNPPALFVLSAPRSGSTLLRVLLAGHPRLFAPPELELLSFHTMAERHAAFAGRNRFWLEGLERAVMEIDGGGPEAARETVAVAEREGWTTERFYAEMQALLGDRLLVDKSPAYALDPAVLGRAEAGFRDARYLHLVRHPHAVVRSFEEARLEQVFFRHPHSFGRRELAELIWTVSHQNIVDFLAGIPEERQHWVRFEELVAEPEKVLRGICAFLGLAYEPAMADPYDGSGSRMTDGLHAQSRMVGDVKLLGHRRIDPAAAGRFREGLVESSLGEPTWALAEALGYARPNAGSRLGPRRIETGLPGSAPSPIPLSFAQERLWFLEQLDPGSAAYHLPGAFRLRGALDPAVLERSLGEIVRRHDALRTTFGVGGSDSDAAGDAGPPVQVVAAAGELALPWVDLGGLPDPAREREGIRVAREEAVRPFDLRRGPLFRAGLVRLAPREHLALVTMHHIVSDGWSMGVLMGELGVLYRAFAQGKPSPLPPLPIQYPDFAVWQRNWLSGETLEAETAYWRQALAGLPPLDLPTDRPRPARRRGRGALRRFALSGELSRSLARRSRDEGATRPSSPATPGRRTWLSARRSPTGPARRSKG